jgi:DNA-binding NtrC family response regulator
MQAENLRHASVLYGLEDPTAEALAGVLQQLGCTVYRLQEGDLPEQCRTLAARIAAEVVFWNGTCPRCAELLAALDKLPQRPAVVMTSRIPETDAWLNALEAGAFDYCGAPFDLEQIQQILDAARLRRRFGDGQRWVRTEAA